MTLYTPWGYTKLMLEKSLKNRLHRLKGQLDKIETDIIAGEDCAKVVPQFLAAKGALVASYEEYVKLSLDSCARSDKTKLKKLIALLVRS